MSNHVRVWRGNERLGSFDRIHRPMVQWQRWKYVSINWVKWSFQKYFCILCIYTGVLLDFIQGGSIWSATLYLYLCVCARVYIYTWFLFFVLFFIKNINYSWKDTWYMRAMLLLINQFKLLSWNFTKSPLTGKFSILFKYI